jgi:hypothetical protein
MTRKTTIDVDKETEMLLTELKVAFGVKSNVGVIRKSLQLSRFMASQADKDSAIVIENEKHEKTKLLLAG